MMRTIPKWAIEWHYVAIPDINVIYISADNELEAANWFSKINHHIFPIEKVIIRRCEEFEQTINRVKTN